MWSPCPLLGVTPFLDYQPLILRPPLIPQLEALLALFAAIATGCLHASEGPLDRRSVLRVLSPEVSFLLATQAKATKTKAHKATGAHQSHNGHDLHGQGRQGQGHEAH